MIREWAAAAAAELLNEAGTAGNSGTAGIAYVQVPYEEHMELVYAAADVAVCRAGANTVAELTVTGTPSILVPLPGAPGDHQNANARVLESDGAAIVIQDDALEAGRLAEELERLSAIPTGWRVWLRRRTDSADLMRPVR